MWIHLRYLLNKNKALQAVYIASLVEIDIPLLHKYKIN